MAKLKLLSWRCPNCGHVNSPSRFFICESCGHGEIGAHARKRRTAYLEPNIHGTLKPGGGALRKFSVRAVQVRVARIAGKFNLDTQRIRFELILELKALAEMAQQKALDTHPQATEYKQSWMRLAAYISQVINSISKTYDEAQVMAELERLEKMIEEATKKDEKAQQP